MFSLPAPCSPPQHPYASSFSSGASAMWAGRRGGTMKRELPRSTSQPATSFLKQARPPRTLYLVKLIAFITHK